MNYSLSDLPDSGQNPVVYMDISLKGEHMGRIYIQLFRETFPAGVENFINIALGKTYRVTEHGSGRFSYDQHTKRTYQGCQFYNKLHNNYIVGGDIYNNNGSNAGTIYNDQAIPPNFGDYYYPHDVKGLVSLIPFYDETSDNTYFDSTFMITLDDAKPTNILRELDEDQIVIGQVYQGLEVLDKINEMIKPYARRKYPEFIISGCGVHMNRNKVKHRPISVNNHRKFLNKPKSINLENDTIVTTKNN
ncbi:structural ppiase [Acanthamoeba polyphaga mimivirus]|uniref:Structural ppiase n=1 Tax=Acanthamoeba polyphaga mimivirus TaxID=212035 RepID=A0A2L2DJV5_MIMIV|nr:structural ppiase [Acanthamoeba polyphaga mimivirus]